MVSEAPAGTKDMNPSGGLNLSVVYVGFQRHSKASSLHHSSIPPAFTMMLLSPQRQPGRRHRPRRQELQLWSPGVGPRLRTQTPKTRRGGAGGSETPERHHQPAAGHGPGERGDQDLERVNGWAPHLRRWRRCRCRCVQIEEEETLCVAFQATLCLTSTATRASSGTSCSPRTGPSHSYPPPGTRRWGSGTWLRKVCVCVCVCVCVVNVFTSPLDWTSSWVAFTDTPQTWLLGVYSSKCNSHTLVCVASWCYTMLTLTRRCPLESWRWSSVEQSYTNVLRDVFKLRF